MSYWIEGHNRRWSYEAMRALLLLASFWVLPLGAEAQDCLTAWVPDSDPQLVMA
jgi:hypothetical protein